MIDRFRIALRDLPSKNALRKLVDVVIISPPENSENGVRIEVRGYLSRLYRGGLFPQRSYQGGGRVIAEEESNPRHADLNSLLFNVSPARVLGSYSAPVPQE
jgi:hypothetical protein